MDEESSRIALGNPLRLPAEDAFHRYPFSTAIADRIANLAHPDGAAVVGLYGKWGYGKSTVLNFIQHHLEHAYPDTTVVLHFNPWYFNDQKGLLDTFLTMLEGLRQRQTTGVRRTAAWAKRFNGAAAMLPVVGAGAAKLLEQIGTELETSLQERHDQQLSQAPANLTTVVLIDDLDRLDRQEVMLILKLVRLNTSLPRMVFVLAFDDEIIAALAGSAYGQNPRMGREFLEKIVQFPFAIPAIGDERLHAYVLNHARRACAQAGIEVAPEGWREFSALVSGEFAVRLRTPRQAIRYGAALDFALPMLQGEADPVHQMVVEGIRMLYPELYAFMRDNRVLIAKAYLDDATAAALGAAMGDAPPLHAGAAHTLLEYFYRKRPDQPFIARALINPSYFDRYFEYAVRPNEIREQEVAAILQLLTDGHACPDQLHALLKRNAGDCAAKLGATLGRQGDSARALLVASVLKASLKETARPLHSHPLAMRSAELCASALLDIPVYPGDSENWLDFLFESQRNAISTALTLECNLVLLPLLLKQLADRNAQRPHHEQVFHAAAWDEWAGRLADRIASHADAFASELYARGSDGELLFEHWRSHGRASFHAWYGRRMTENPDEFLALLDYFAERSIEAYLRINPNAADKWVDITVLHAACCRHYGRPSDGSADRSLHAEVLDMYQSDMRAPARREARRSPA